MSRNSLVLENLSRAFNNRLAVDSVSVVIPQGEFVGIIGRSGAGKSTLLRLINRMIDSSGGEIRCDGRTVSTLKGQHLREWRRDCAMIFQQFNLVERLDVLTNVLIGRLAGHGFLSAMTMRFSDAERALAIEALDRLDVAPQALQRAGTLSGGQQQRVAIAKALVQKPRIMLADEPIASLDPANATRVMEALRKINREDGITVLANLHTIDTARNYCDRVIAMKDGRVVFDGAPRMLSDDRLHDIYGLEGLDGFDPAITSTSMPQRNVA